MSPLVENVVENVEKIILFGNFQTISNHTNGFDAYNGVEMGQFLPEEGDIDLHMVVNGFGIVAPDPGKNNLFGEDFILRLQKRSVLRLSKKQ